MYDEGDEDDDEKALREALALSMVPDGLQNEEHRQVEEKKPEAAKQPEIDIDANFMKDVIGDLGIDIDPNQLDDIMNEAKKDQKEGDKKDGEEGGDKK